MKWCSPVVVEWGLETGVQSCHNNKALKLRHCHNGCAWFTFILGPVSTLEQGWLWMQIQKNVPSVNKGQIMSSLASWTLQKCVLSMWLQGFGVWERDRGRQRESERLSWCDFARVYWLSWSAPRGPAASRPGRSSKQGQGRLGMETLP